MCVCVCVCVYGGSCVEMPALTHAGVSVYICDVHTCM